MNFKAETFTPVHIGTGQKYGKQEFIVEGNYVKRILFSNFCRRLDANQVNELVDELSDRNFDLKTFLDKRGIMLTEEDIRYSLKNKLGLPTSRMDSIREQIKTGEVPFVPGSSIKGALRTAVLWSYVKNNPGVLDEASRLVKNPVKQVKKPKDPVKQLSDFLVMKAFGTAKEDKNNKYIKLDAKYDVFKFVNVSDFMPNVSGPSYELNLQLLYTYSLKQGNNFENWTKRNGRTLQLLNYIEGLEGSFYGNISLNPQIISALKEKSESYALLSEKLQLLGITPCEDLVEMESQMIANFKDLFKEFNSWAIGHELALIRISNNKDFSHGIERVKEENQKSFMIRVGFGIGTVFQTVIKLIEESDEDLYSSVRKVVTKYQNPRIPYPKTIDLNSEKRPMGWLKLIQ